MAKQSKGYDAPNILVDRVEAVPVGDLRMFHKNPRIGNVEKIAESLKTSGQFKPIVVNVGTQTGRKNEILAGNHTWLATKRNQDERILTAFVDVDDETATRINLADNRTAEDSEYDDSILAELLATLPSATGTGFDQEEIDNLLAGLEVDVDSTLDALDEQERERKDFEDQLKAKETFDGSDLGDEPDPRAEGIKPRSTGMDDDEYDTPKEDDEAPTIEGASDELKGGFSLKDEIDLDPKKDYLGRWGIPRMRSDMFMEFSDIPKNLKAWAGSATKDWPDDDQWWLYNWGIDSTSGMKDVSKVVCSFYAWDEYFENWWHYPARYATKLLNSKIKYSLTPNWSCWADSPGTENLWSLYRARWVGRYLQEAGIKVAPDINWPMGDRDFLEKYVLATLPKGIPLISMQLQTFDKEDVVKAGETQREEVQLIFDTLKPKGLLLYAGKPGKDWFDKNIKPGCEVFFVETRMAALAESQKNRTRKKTI